MYQVRLPLQQIATCAGVAERRSLRLTCGGLYSHGTALAMAGRASHAVTRATSPSSVDALQDPYARGLSDLELAHDATDDRQLTADNSQVAERVAQLPGSGPHGTGGFSEARNGQFRGWKLRQKVEYQGASAVRKARSYQAEPLGGAPTSTRDRGWTCAVSIQHSTGPRQGWRPRHSPVRGTKQRLQSATWSRVLIGKTGDAISPTARDRTDLRVRTHFELMQYPVREHLLADLAVESVLDRVRVGA